MARKKKPKPRPYYEEPLKLQSDEPSDIGPFPARSVPKRYERYTKHAGYQCVGCPFQTSKKGPDGRQSLRAHKRLHLRQRKARKRGILGALVFAGLIIAAVAQMLDAPRFLPLVTEHLHLVLLAMLGVSLVVFGVSVAVLNARSIRREFYRALKLLVPVGVSALALELAEPPVDPVHPLLPHVVSSAPLFAALVEAMALPKLAGTWNTSGLNPRLRPGYQELVEFINKGTGWTTEVLITRLEYQAVTGRPVWHQPITGNKGALRKLKEAKDLRSMLQTRDPLGMSIKRRERARDKKEIISAMARLKL